MNRFIAFVLDWPKSVLLVLLVISVILAGGLKKLRFDNSVEVFMPQSDSEYAFYNETKNIYGDSGRFFIMSVSHPDLWSADTFRRIETLIADIEEYKEYDETREENRLKRLEAATQTAPLESSDLLGQFADDPPFARYLNRKLVKIADGKELLAKKELGKLRKAALTSKELKQGEMVDRIISPFTSKDISGQDDTLETYDLIEKDDDGRRILPSTREDFDALKKRLARNPAFEKGIFYRDPASGEIRDLGVIVRFINLKDQDPISREMLELIQSHDDLTITPQGAPVANIWFNNYLHRDLGKFLPYTLLAVIVIFFFNFRSIRGILLPSITLGMSTFWILGLMGYCGIRLTALGISLPPLMIAVGSSYGIHILNQYYIDFDMIGRTGKRAGLKIAMGHIATTVLLAALTTFVSFGSLATSQLIAMSQWGVFSGIGVLFALIISCTLIPAALALMPHRRPRLLMKKDREVKKTAIDTLIELAITAATRHHKQVLLVVLVLIAVSVVGLSRLNVESDFLLYFKENDYIRTSALEIEKKFGGRWGFNLLIDTGAADGVKTPVALNAVETIRRWLTAPANKHLNIGRTDAFSDYIKTMHFAMNEDNLDYYRIPENPMDITDYLEIYSGDDDDADGRIDEFEAYVDEDFRTLNLLARFCQKEDYSIGTADIKRILGQVREYLDKNLPPGLKARITGFPVMNVKMVEYIISGQLQSLLSSLVIIFIIVTLLFKRFSAGILSLIPMSTAVLFNFGIMGFFGINLDTVTSIIASITIGIGVDDTIHFLNTFRHIQRQGGSTDECIRRTLQVSGKAIIFTSLALILGFAVLTISSFKPVIFFGTLMGITMTATTIGALVILPSVIKLTGVNLGKREVEQGLWRYIDIGKFFGLEGEEAQEPVAK
ncbi:MAG: efflux RND transporter permease subunit [Thermodesulfobacteriota bacterium]